MTIKKIVRVSRVVSRISVKRTISKSFPKTVQRGTVKYLPFMFESIQSGSVDLKSLENATVEVILCDVITVGLSVALVLWNNELKKMSKNDSSSDVTDSK